MKLTNQFHPILSLRMSGIIYPRPQTLSWRAKKQRYVNILLQLPHSRHFSKHCSVRACVFRYVSYRHHDCIMQITFIIKKSCFMDTEISKSCSQNPAVRNFSSHDNGQVKGQQIRVQIPTCAENFLPSDRFWFAEPKLRMQGDIPPFPCDDFII